MPTDIPSWLWWFFSVVIIGIVVGLVPVYLKPRIDNIWARYSKSRREKLEREEIEFEKQVYLMLTDVAEFADVKIHDATLRIRVAIVLVFYISSAFLNQLLSYYINSNTGLNANCSNYYSWGCLSSLKDSGISNLYVLGLGIFVSSIFFMGLDFYRTQSVKKLLDEYRKRKKEINQKLIIEKLKSEIIELEDKLSKLRSKKKKTTRDEREIKGLGQKLSRALSVKEKYDLEAKAQELVRGPFDVRRLFDK